MTDKKRLEEIDKRAKHKVLGNIEGEIKFRLTEINTKDYEWLIEQAERVQELEQQNKRYREALEFYANKINYLTFIENGKSNIEHDQGEKARKALEESE